MQPAFRFAHTNSYRVWRLHPATDLWRWAFSHRQKGNGRDFHWEKAARCTCRPL